MSRSTYITDIENLYQNLHENTEVGKITKALGDADDKDKGKDIGKSDAPENRDDLTKAVEASDGEKDIYMKKISERLKENKEKTGKSGRDDINTSEVMSEEPKNIFDKLYSTIMEGDDPFGELDSMNDELGGDELGVDDELDIGGDEVSISIPKDLAQTLLDGLQAAMGGEEDELGGEDEFGGEEEGGLDDEMLGDAVVSEPAPKALGGHGDRAHKDAGNTAAGSNKVAGAAAPDAGKADTGHIDEDPTPKELGGHGDRAHKDAGNTAAGSNKVNNPKTKAPGE